jgi:hypothetical protein
MNAGSVQYATEGHLVLEPPRAVMADRFSNEQLLKWQAFCRPDLKHAAA